MKVYNYLFVLLGAKFESCIENIISEYVDKINTEADKNLIQNTLNIVLYIINYLIIKINYLQTILIVFLMIVIFLQRLNYL